MSRTSNQLACLVSSALTFVPQFARAQDAPAGTDAPSDTKAAQTNDPSRNTEPAASPVAMDDPSAAASTPSTELPAAEPKPPKPPPYSLPFQLRPVVAATVIRSDTAFAFYKPDAAASGGSTEVTTLLGSYKITPDFAPLVRLGLVNNSPPGLAAPAPSPPSGTAFMNPVIGATYALKPTTDLRLAFFLGVAIPVGSGGGNSPDAGTRLALAPAGVLARSAMDNAMFAVNYLTFFPGVGFAWVSSGFTAQIEATLLELIRVRGDQVDKDSTRTNLTMGLHLGYFFIPELSLGAELRHQRWLSTPASVEVAPATRDTTTVAVGPRLHFKLSDTVWFRPAVVYARGIDNPMKDANYNIVQLDLPFSF